MNLQLENKKALVFGSSTGLGYAIAESLLAEKTKVCVNSRDRERLLQTQSKLHTEFGVVADLTQAHQAQKAVSSAVQQMQGLDILVMNTGGPNKGHFAEITNEQWLFDFQNLWLSFTDAVKEALPEMKKNNYGRILLVTSLAAKEPLNALTTSNGLRAGLSGLCKSLSNEVATFGITVNVLLPGYTNTDRLKNLKLSEESIKQMVPTGRLGDPRELADLAAFLSSPKAGYITGQAIAVDGGALKGY